MSKSLALILAGLLALFVAGPAMAVDVTKTVTNSNEASTKFDTTATVTKTVDIGIKGVDLPATGGVDVQGDSIFKELDVNVQDQENVVKFFELDDSAHSSWSIDGSGSMNAAEQLQNGAGNQATINQLTLSTDGPTMNVGLQYQVGGLNTATITQRGITSPLPTPVNNFGKQVQIGDGNIATITQN